MWEGPGPGEIVPDLHPEVAALLVQFADDAMKVERVRRTFFASSYDGVAGLSIHTPSGARIDAPEEDIGTLAESGYIRPKSPNVSGTFEFVLTDVGFAVAAKYGGAPDAFQHVEGQVLRVLDDAAFRGRHPAAYSLWQNAARLAAEDPIAHATRIGHDAREAMQAFASSITTQAGVTVTAGPTETVAKIRAVLDSRRETLGHGVEAFLTALLAYWGTVSDLAQRQEHGAQKEGERLAPLDAGRLVLNTAVVMFEIDRSFS